jgi:hypothetical protein
LSDGPSEIGLDDRGAVARAVRDAAGAGRDDLPRADSPTPPLPHIEGYDILRELTHGGQGVVYLAVQRSTKRKLALMVFLACM